MDVKTFLSAFSDIDEGDEYIDAWRTRIAERLELVSVLFLDLGLREPAAELSVKDVWFAPLPVAEGPHIESEYIVAVVTDTEAFVASPFELPWLAEKALDFRRSEIVTAPRAALH